MENSNIPLGTYPRGLNHLFVKAILSYLDSWYLVYVPGGCWNFLRLGCTMPILVFECHGVIL